jgi:hypothetical protein
MSFWDLQEEVIGIPLEKIKAIEGKLAKEKTRKKVAANTQDMIISLKVDLAKEEVRNTQDMIISLEHMSIRLLCYMMLVLVYVLLMNA